MSSGAPFHKIAVDAETKHIPGAAIPGTGGDEVVIVLPDVLYAKALHTVVQIVTGFADSWEHNSDLQVAFWSNGYSLDDADLIHYDVAF